MSRKEWEIHNPTGNQRVIVTKNLPGRKWLQILTRADCRVEVCMSDQVLNSEDIVTAMGSQCHGAIGQLTETWGHELFDALSRAGGKAYSNYAVGFNNVVVEAATEFNIPVGNTPGVLTETTAEMAVALTFAAARRTGESEQFLRKGKYKGWLPDLFLGELLWRKTLGIIGAGRIGEAYARMMIEGHKMNLIYYDLVSNDGLETCVAAYNEFLAAQGEDPVSCKRAEHVEELLKESDCVSVHTLLNDSTYHLIDTEKLALMKKNAILINTSRGPVIDEAALVSHCQNHPEFRIGLDVFEHEPMLEAGLVDLHNAVIVPHIASATRWTREGMAVLAARNVAGILKGHPAWNRPDITCFLEDDPPAAAPSIINARELGLAEYEG